MTLAQNLLGKNYKWWYLFVYSYKKSTNYRFQNVMTFIKHFIPVVINFSIYGAFLAPGEFAFYFLLTNLFLKLVGNAIGFSWDISAAIYSGKISSDILRPSSLNPLFILQLLFLHITQLKFTLANTIQIRQFWYF